MPTLADGSSARPRLFQHGTQAELGLLRALQGRHSEAAALVSRAIDGADRNRFYHHVTYLVARVHALRGNPDETARWLKETIDWGFPCYPMFSTDSFLDPVRSTPPVQKVMNDLKTVWDGYRQELRVE